MDPVPPLETTTTEFKSKSIIERVKEIPTKYLFFGLFVVLLASVGISSIILFSKKNSLRVPLLSFDNTNSEDKLTEEQLIDDSEQPQTVVQEVNSTPTPTFSPDSTASWSAFQSLRYGYYFKYPPGWTATRTAQSDPAILDYVVLNPVGNASASAITMSYTTRSSSQSLAVYPQQGTPILVNTIPATQKKIQDSEGGVFVQVVIPDENNSVVFFAQQAYENILTGILSTFIFL